MIAASLYPPFSRNFNDEEDYTSLVHSTERKSSRFPSSLPPILRWRRGNTSGARTASLQPDQFRSPAKALIIGIHSDAALYVQKFFGLSDDHWVGTLVLPGARRGPSGGDTLDPANASNSMCNIFRKGDIVMVLCGYTVPPAVAHSWARTLLDAISAEVVVVLTSAAGDSGRSSASEGVRLVATSLAECHEDCVKMSRGFQPLRTPTLLTGPAAALISHCQRHGRAAVCFAVAEKDQGDRGNSMKSFACTRGALELLTGEVMVKCAVDEVGSAEQALGGMGSLYI